MSQKPDTGQTYVTFVLRGESALPISAVIAAALVVRRGFGHAPEMDTKLRTVTIPAMEDIQLRPIAEAAVTAASEKCGVRPWIAVVPAACLADPEAAVLGERWIEAAALSGAPRVVEHHDFRTVQRLLEDREWAKELASLLAPLEKYDWSEKTSVLRTLDAALLEASSPGQVAGLLGIDRHTVSRHLNTASSILGRDVRRGVDRMLVAQALLARRVVGRSKRRSRSKRSKPVDPPSLPI